MSRRDTNTEGNFGDRPPEAEINLHTFNEVFRDFIARPSYLEAAEQSTFEPLEDLGEQYHQAIERIRDTFYEASPLSEKEAEVIDRRFLNSQFGGSDGSEIRMVLTGFKPVAWIAEIWGEEEKTLAKIPYEDFAAYRVVRDGNLGTSFGFTHGDELSRQNESYHSGYVYNTEAIARSVLLNSDIYEKLGIDASLTGEDFLLSALESKNEIARSLLFGYGALTSILHYVINEEELYCKYMLDADFEMQRDVRTSVFWNSLESFLTPDQLALAKVLRNNRPLADALDIYSSSTSGTDFVHSTPNNRRAQASLEKCGLAPYRDRMVNLLGHDDDDDILL